MKRLRIRRDWGGSKLRPGAMTGAWAGLWPYTQGARHLLLGAVGSAVAWTSLQILRPWPLKIVIDYATSPAEARTVFGHAAPATLVVAGSALAVLAVAGLSAWAAFGQRLFGAKVGQLLAYRLRRDVFRHLLRVSLDRHDEARTGDLVLRLTADMTLVRNLFVGTSLKLASQTMVVVGVAALLLVVDHRLGLAAMAVIPPLLFTASRSSGKIRDVVRKQRRREGAVAAAASESLGSVTLIKLHGAEEGERERLQSGDRDVLGAGFEAARLQADFERTVELLVAVGTCLVIGVGASGVIAGRTSPGTLVLALSYLGMLYKPIRSFSRLVGRMSKGVVATERIRELLDHDAEDLHDPGAVVPVEVRGELRFEGIGLEYDPGQPVLQGIDLEIRPGERVAFVGRSGAGKTSLVRLLPRLYRPTTGTIRLDGIPLEKIELATLRDAISFVMQETVLLGVSLRENIAYGRELTDDEIHDAAVLAGIHDRILRLPEGYDTVLREHGIGLSGGERQRVALARAFARRAPIVVLDEPDAFLDPTSKDLVWDAVDRLTTGRTSLCVVHDIARAQTADRIVVMDHGKIVSHGTHEELFADCALYRELCSAGRLKLEGATRASA
ncbi:MAG: ABC transporter ATP-binding protein [bacterium]